MEQTRADTLSGVNASFLRPSLEAMGITEDLWSKSKKIDFGSELDAAKAEAKAWKTIWSAGQGVTSIKDVQPTKDLIDQLIKEFKVALSLQKKNFDNGHFVCLAVYLQHIRV